MKIVIAGAGDMGTHLAKMLSGNGHDLTVVDVESKALAEVGGLVDVVTVEGDTTQFSVLRKSGVRKCDLFIAVRSVENDNILSAVMAKQLGAKKAIARVDSNEYLEPRTIATTRYSKSSSSHPSSITVRPKSGEVNSKRNATIDN